MEVRTPQLSIRLLPLLDIIFILLAFFVILPHGSFEKKSSQFPPTKPLQESDELLEASQDIPIYIKILPQGQIFLQEKESDFAWRSQKLALSSAKDLDLLWKILEEVFQRAKKSQEEEEKNWEQHKKKKQMARPPKILIQIEIHRLSFVWIPYKISQHLKDFIQKDPARYLLAVRSIQ